MKTWLKRAAAAVLSLSLLAAPVLAAAETAGSSTLNLSDNTVYTYSTQSVTSDSGKQTNLHENIFTYRKEAQRHEQDYQDPRGAGLQHGRRDQRLVL